MNQGASSSGKTEDAERAPSSPLREEGALPRGPTFDSLALPNVTERCTPQT
jgi:hypothetical protein